jgi:hypothetical protein
MSFISILVYACFPLAFCVIHIGQWVFLMVYIVPKLWPYIWLIPDEKRLILVVWGSPSEVTPIFGLV